MEAVLVASNNGPAPAALTYRRFRRETRNICPPLAKPRDDDWEVSRHYDAERTVGNCIIEDAGDVRQAELILRPDDTQSLLKPAATDFRITAWRWKSTKLERVFQKTLITEYPMRPIWLPWREMPQTDSPSLPT